MVESNMSGNPYELSAEEKQRRIDEAREDRLARRAAEEDEHWENGTGPASDGRVLDAAGNAGLHAMRDDGPLDRAARRVFEDPDAAMGGAIAGVGDKLRGQSDQAAGPEGDASAGQGQTGPDELTPDSPPIELRMPK